MNHTVENLLYCPTCRTVDGRPYKRTSAGCYEVTEEGLYIWWRCSSCKRNTQKQFYPFQHPQQGRCWAGKYAKR